MSTIKVSAKELSYGDVIVEQLFVANTNISLFVKNTVVDKSVKDKLIELNIGKISIFRPDVVRNEAHSIKKEEFKEEYREKVTDVKDVFKSILDGQKIDLEKVSKISDDIFKNVDDLYVAIEAISELKDFDEYTYIHSVNVALYSMLLAKWLELDRAEIKNLVKAAVLHDIGKAKVADNILNKPGKLTDEEFLEMKKHPQYGYDICTDMGNIKDEVMEAVLSHHEKMDGSGYPNGKKANEISKFSKIIAVCDVYDAITSKRVYKDKVTPFETFDEIIQHGYGKLDTEIMLTFLNNIGGLYVGLKVKMNTGEIGEIVFIPPNNLSQPLIKIGEKFIDPIKDLEYIIEEII